MKLVSDYELNPNHFIHLLTDDMYFAFKSHGRWYHNLESLKYGLETEYEPILKSKELGLDPFGSGKYFSIDSTVYIRDREMKDKLILEKIADKRKIDFVGHNHGKEKDAFFVLSDDSRHNINCSMKAFVSALINRMDIKYRNEDVTDFNIAHPYALAKLTTNKRNAFLEITSEVFYFMDGFNIQEMSAKNKKTPDGLYTPEGIINELTLLARNGIDIKIKECVVTYMTVDTFKADINVEQNGKKEIYESLTSTGLILAKLFNAPIYLDENLPNAVN